MDFVLIYEDHHNYGVLTTKVVESEEDAHKFMNNEETVPRGECANYVIVSGKVDIKMASVDRT
jgi:hypothetical protein